MKVLILGATGSVGFPIAQALVRGGHTIYGLARSESKAKTLAAEEVIPIDASNPSTESVDDILQTVVKVSGAKGYEYKSPENAFEEALQSTALVRPYLGSALLGWSARKPSLVDGMGIHYAAWRATSA
ncbi:hypothetical protein FB45DRAFT_1006191 [Roridomyces roridus]|uniref:NAD-dependent epimerase/dehydratase domain-containing protein n=1 Tax=Roridomyces roridus TaxID=1738132 RepID=A0AAD7BIX5_9AGAR|nr:hypothetical protein FB45DRAFT_1006191 [Roridomyces roridus]